MHDSLCLEWPKYASVALVSLLLCIALFVKNGMHGSELSLADYLLYLFGGMETFTPDISTPFRFPAPWMLIMLLILFVVLGYPHRSLSGIGQHAMILSGSRVTWWIAMCAWTLCCLAIVFAVAGAVAAVWTGATGGGFSLQTSEGFPALILSGKSGVPYPQASVSLLLSVPVVVAALSFLQLVVTLAVGPSAAFVLMIVYLFAGSYFDSTFLLGNFAMAARSSVYIGHFDPVMGAVLSLAVCLTCVAVGMVVVQRLPLVGERSFR